MNYKKLYKAADENEAYFIKGLLREYSIDVNLLGKGLSISDISKKINISSEQLIRVAYILEEKGIMKRINNG